MKVDISQERPSFAKFSGFLCTPSSLNDQNLLSSPEAFCQHPLTAVHVLQVLNMDTNCS